MLKLKDIQVVIPSRKRVDSCQQTVNLFRDPIVCIAEEELSDYRPLGVKLLTHPNDVYGLGRLRQWILDNVAHKCVVQVNDDVKSLLCNIGIHVRRIIDPDAIERIILGIIYLTKQPRCVRFNTVG